MMKNTAMQARMSDEITQFIEQRKTLNLATIDTEGHPFSSYAPFAIGDNCLYVLLSEVARHATNLQHNPKASALIIEDESEADNIFARIRVNLLLDATVLAFESNDWQLGIDTLVKRQGEMIKNLSQLSDFRLFKLTPKSGRYVKGFGKAFAFENSLNGENMTHLKEGHQARSA